MEAINAEAIDEAMDRSQSFAKRRHGSSHANIGSKTQRRGKSSKPLAVSERLMISSVQLRWSLSARLRVRVTRAFAPVHQLLFFWIHIRQPNRLRGAKCVKDA